MTIEEIEREYGRKIKASEDPLEQANLRAERAEAISEARAAETKTAYRSSWIKDALNEYPLVKEFPEMIRGETEDEIRASAASAHAKLEKLAGPPRPSEPAPGEDPARAAYGNPAGGGGGSPVRTPGDPDTEFIESFAKKFNNDPKSVTSREIARYEMVRGGRRFAEGIADAGKRWTSADLPWTEAGKRR